MSDKGLINIASTKLNKGCFIYTDVYGTELLDITKKALSIKKDWGSSIKLSTVILRTIASIEECSDFESFGITEFPELVDWNVLRIECESKSVLFMKKGWDGISLGYRLDTIVKKYSFEEFIKADDAELGKFYEHGKDTIPL